MRGAPAKSWFISLYLLLAAIISWIAGSELLAALDALGRAQAGNARWQGWLGALLTTLPIILFVTLLTLTGRIARTSVSLPLVTLPAFMGWGLTLYWQLRNPQGSGFDAAFVTATVGLLLLMLYMRWYSRFGKRESSRLRVGAPLPAFTAVDCQGQAFDSELLAGKPVLLMFYRGNWCPLCSAQVRELAADYRRLAATGVEVILISPQPQKQSEQLARRFDAPMRFLVDRDNRIARLFDIEAPGGTPAGLQLLGYPTDTVLPTVIITDDQGRILYLDQTDNYRVRPEPDTFFNVLSEHGYV